MNTNISIDISNLTYDELRELENSTDKLISLIKQRKDGLYESWSKAQNIKYNLERMKQKSKKEDFENNVLPKIKDFLLKNLIPSQSIIKVKGARDGSGIRLFFGFYSNNDILECRQIFRNKKYFRNTRTGEDDYKIHESYGQITNHMIDKVTHIEVNGKFVPLKELI